MTVNTNPESGRVHSNAQCKNNGKKVVAQQRHSGRDEDIRCFGLIVLGPTLTTDAVTVTQGHMVGEGQDGPECNIEIESVGQVVASAKSHRGIVGIHWPIAWHLA